MTKKVRQKVRSVTVAAILVDITLEEGDGDGVGEGGGGGSLLAIARKQSPS